MRTKGSQEKRKQGGRDLLGTSAGGGGAFQVNVGCLLAANAEIDNGTHFRQLAAFPVRNIQLVTVAVISRDQASAGFIVKIGNLAFQRLCSALRRLFTTCSTAFQASLGITA